MRGNTSHLVAALLAALVSPASSFWRLPCKAPIVVQRADPIVNPGKLSGHTHTIMGGNGFGFDMTYADTQNSTCSSCMVTKDFSNYWVPNLYYKAKNGTFINVGQNGGATVYYLQRADEKDPEYSKGLLAFPKGFRMLAGNPFLRNYTDIVEQQAISYACLGVSGPETHGFPTQNCPNGLRTQVFFPSCWDGVNLDSPDHISHMAYPSGMDSGNCPPSHPKRFISIFYEVIWNTPDFADMWYDGHQPFVLAQGDDTGYGYHGDFVNGWDVPTLQKAVNECTSSSGVIEDCKVFDFFTDDFSQDCKVPTSVDEPTTGVLDALPGCNPVQSGPSMAKAVSGCGAPTTISTPEYNFVDMTVSKGFQYVGCGTDIAGQARTLSGDSLTAENMTNEKCVDFCVSKGFTIAGTEFTKQCFCGNSIPSDRAPIPGLMGNCFMPCAGDSKEMCGGASRISLYQKCGATCQNVAYSVNNRTSSGAAGDGASAGHRSPSPAKSSSPSSNAVSSAAVIAPTSAPSAPASSAAAAGQEVASYPAGPAVSAGDSAPSDSIVIVYETQTVIPMASSPVSIPTPSGSPSGGAGAGSESGSNSGSIGNSATTIVANLTVAVTSCLPDDTSGAYRHIHSHATAGRLR